MKKNKAIIVLKILLLVAYYFYFYIVVYHKWMIIQILNLYLLSLFFLSLPSFIFELKHNKALGFWFFFYPLLFFSFTINVGFDMTDELFAVTNSYFYEPRSNIVAINPISYYFTHFFYKIIDKPYVLLTRILRVSLVSLTFLFSYLAANKINKRSSYKPDIIDLIFVLIASSGISVTYMYFFIPHDHIPVFLLSLSIWLFVSYLYVDKSQWSYVFLTLFGFTSILVIYSRFASFIYVIPTVLTLFFINRVKIKDCFFLFVGLIGALVLLNLLHFDLMRPFKIFNLESLVQNNCVPVNYDHNIKNVINQYFEEALIILKFLVVIFILLLIFNFLLKKNEERHNRSFNIIITSILILIVVLAFWRYHFPNIFFRDTHFTWMFLSFAVFLSMWLYKMIFDKHLDATTLLLNALIILISFAGSNGGLRKIAYGGGALGYAIIFILLQSRTSLHKSIVISLLILIFALGFKLRIAMRYRDYNDKYLTRKYFTESPFTGIRTSPDKYYNIISFYKRISRYNLADSNYIVINKAFAFPLMLDKKPAYICWLNDPHKFSKKILTNNKIKYVIFSTRSMRLANWDSPKRTNYLAIPRDRDIVEQCKNILDSLFRPVVYSRDSIFVLYKRK